MNELKSFSYRVLLPLACGLMAVQAGTAVAEAGEESQLSRAQAKQAVVEGQVIGQAQPVAKATVYAYEVATYALKKVITDDYGRFLFGSLPAGMYKIIAYKDGFAPTIELLLRRREQERQYLEIEIRNEQVGDIRQGEDYWSVRSRVPADVLRDIHSLDGIWAGDARKLWPETRIAGVSQFEGEMLAHGGYEQLGAAYGEAHLTGADFDLQGVVGEMQVGLNGRYQLLVPEGTGFSADVPDAEVRTVAVAVESARQSKLQVATSSGQLTNLRDGDMAPVDMDHYQVQWSGRAGERGRSDVMAQYTEEANYHKVGWVDPISIPEASRTWNLKGLYTGELTDRTSLKAGLSYRQRTGEGAFGSFADDSQSGFDPLSDESIGVYGLAGSQIMPSVMVEYGLYSSVRDGSLSLMPHGGLVVNLGADWKARTSFARRVENNDDRLPYRGFSSASYSDSNSCRDVGEACYEVLFSRGEGDDSISVGAVHREYAETLRLYFSPDFFNRLESLFLVKGDELPEVQFSMVRRIAPKVLAKLESNIAAGGGGIFYAADELAYENEVRYLVTSLDTRFQQTSTGVFVAFHHLEQAFNPVSDQAASQPATEIEMQRLQLMLTQDLNVLADFASNWAVRFNVEFSRGVTPYQLSTDDELHKKLTGGISVSF